MPFPPLVDPIDALPSDEAARAARHIALSAFGEVAQRRLAAAHVAIVGAGGLGSPAVLALAAAGVGELIVIDDDDVDLSNLQRQVIHRLSDIGAPKVDSAVRAAADLSPFTRVRPVAERLDADSADSLLAGADLVIDGSDTFATRAVVAAACERAGIPLVWGVVQEFHAQVTVFWSAPPAGEDPRVLADLHPVDAAGEPPSCAEAGVLGTLTLQTGALLAAEAIKLITGVGEPLFGRIAVIDALRGTATELPLLPAADAPATRAPQEPGRTPSASPAAPVELTAQEMLDAQAAGAVLLDVREPWETAQGVVDGSVVVPLGDLLADPGQVGDGPVVVICAHGIRARTAADALRARGVEADVLAGGLAAWT